MDNTDRTEPFEVPPEMIAVLRQAAERGLEFACGNRGEWNNSVRAEVLGAARTYDLFHYGAPGAADIAELADKAVRWTEQPNEMPTTLNAIGHAYDRLSALNDLIVLRNDALRHVGHPVPDDARGGSDR